MVAHIFGAAIHTKQDAYETFEPVHRQALSLARSGRRDIETDRASIAERTDRLAASVSALRAHHVAKLVPVQREAAAGWVIIATICTIARFLGLFRGVQVAEPPAGDRPATPLDRVE